MRKLIDKLTVINNERLSPEYFLLELKTKQKLSGIVAGQFAQLEIPGTKDVYLRRPFSIHDVTPTSLKFLIRIVGKGTRILAEQKIGTAISVVFPLGKGFPIFKNTRALLVGGGCGIAPLLLLAKQCAKSKTSVTLIYGGRTKKDIVLLSEFKKYAKVHVATEDASQGTKGLVTDQMKKMDLKAFDLVYTCGPEIMMKNVVKLAATAGAKVYCSLESLMGCGFGVCLCCVTETKKEGHLCVCTEGPVFESGRLKW